MNRSPKRRKNLPPQKRRNLIKLTKESGLRTSSPILSVAILPSRTQAPEISSRPTTPTNPARKACRWGSRSLATLTCSNNTHSFYSKCSQLQLCRHRGTSFLNSKLYHSYNSFHQQPSSQSKFSRYNSRCNSRCNSSSKRSCRLFKNSHKI